MSVRKKTAIRRRITAVFLMAVMTVGLSTGAPAKTTHDELDFTLTVQAKRSTVTVKPNNTLNGSGNNHVVNPMAPSAEGEKDAFTVIGPVGDDITIGAGSADVAYIDHLEESDPSVPNVTGFTYRFGTEDETVTVHWKLFDTYFDKADGTGAKDIITTEYNQTNSMPNATRSGYAFQGWYDAGGNKVGESGTIYTQTENVPTYWAHWACNHTTPNTGRVNSYSDAGGTHLVSTKCTNCGTVVASTYANHHDSDNNGLCDECGHDARELVTYTLTYKTSSNANARTVTEANYWNNITNSWVAGASFQNLGMSSSHNWRVGSWNGTDTGCPSVRTLASAGYKTGHYYKRDYGNH